MKAKEDASFLVFKPEYSDIYYWLKQLQLLQPKHTCLVLKTDSSFKAIKLQSFSFRCQIMFMFSLKYWRDELSGDEFYAFKNRQINIKGSIFCLSNIVECVKLNISEF